TARMGPGEVLAGVRVGPAVLLAGLLTTALPAARSRVLRVSASAGSGKARAAAVSAASRRGRRTLRLAIGDTEAVVTIEPRNPLSSRSMAATTVRICRLLMAK